jgi:photosystem II stability/assembly factor-like uncharacterized protein
MALHTTDGGANWQMQTTPVTSELDRTAFSDALHGWIVGVDGVILHTSDGGTTWQQQASPTADNLYGVSCVDSLHVWAVAFSDVSPYPGHVLHTSDGGVTWETQADPDQSEMWNVSMQDTLNGWICGYYRTTGYGALWHTTDGGQTWARTLTSYSTDLLAIKAAAQTVLATSSWGLVLRSTNGGTNWTADTSGTDNIMFGLAIAGPNQAWIAGDGGAILHWQGGATAISDHTPPLPGTYSLGAYPNPFNPLSVIELNLPRAQRVRLSVFDIQGRLVTVLADRMVSAGMQRFTFDGSTLASGIYFARAESGDYVKTVRVMLVK